jgi:hypothetical protein
VPIAVEVIMTERHETSKRSAPAAAASVVPGVVAAHSRQAIELMEELRSASFVDSQSHMLKSMSSGIPGVTPPTHLVDIVGFFTINSWITVAAIAATGRIRLLHSSWTVYGRRSTRRIVLW